MITRKDIAAHLESDARVGFLDGSKTYQPLRRPFTREVASSRAAEMYTDMGSPPWPQLGAGKAGPGGTDARTGAPQVGQIQAGVTVTILGGEERALRVVNLDYYIATAIEHNAIDDDQAGDLESWALSAGMQFEKHKDYLAFDALNAGGATTKYGAGYDGLSFFNDAHIDPGAEYQTGQDNSYALPLSMDNFETVKVAGSKFVDGRNVPVGLNHRLLVVPPNLERKATQIVVNPEDGGTANRAINPYAGSSRMIVAPGSWLDDTAWVLIDDTLPEKPVHIQNRQTPELVIWDDESVGNGVRYFKWVARYAAFYGDWRLALLGNT